MTEDPKNSKQDEPRINDDGLAEGVEVELPPLFSGDMLRDTRFLLIVACALIAGVFAIVVYALGYTTWALSVFLFTFNVLLVSWFYFLVKHLRRQVEEESARAEQEDHSVMTGGKARGTAKSKKAED